MGWWTVLTLAGKCGAVYRSNLLFKQMLGVRAPEIDLYPFFV